MARIIAEGFKPVEAAPEVAMFDVASDAAGGF